MLYIGKLFAVYFIEGLSGQIVDSEISKNYISSFAITQIITFECVIGKAPFFIIDNQIINALIRQFDLSFQCVMAAGSVSWPDGNGNNACATQY